VTDDARQSQIERSLLEYVSSQLVLVRRSEPLEPDEDLLSAGIVDSMGVMQLVAFMEDSLGVSVDDEDIVPENFRSIRTLAALVVRKLDPVEAG
jgi:acyl carrier protein